MVNLIRLFFVLLLSAFVSVNAVSLKTQSLRSAGYFCGTDGTCKWYKPGDIDSTWLFDRYTYAMGYADCPMSIAEWREKSPECRLVLYVSGTDMPTLYSPNSRSYNSGKKSTWIRNRLVQMGQIQESAYMHFYNDTQIRGWTGTTYDTMLIPGTYSMTITAKDSVSRVPNSYINYLFMAGNTYTYPARMSPNFTSKYLRQAYKEYLCQIFDVTGDTAHWVGKTGYWDGVYFDNYSPVAMQGSGLISGGLVVETGADPYVLLTYATPQFANWGWNLMQTFGREVRDTLQIAEQWAVDHTKKILAYNVGQSFKNAYVFPDSCGADALNYEFGFDPVFSNNASVYRLENLYTHDSLGAINGSTSTWASPARMSYGNGSIGSVRRSMYNNYCFYLVARADSTWFYLRPSFGNAYGAFYNNGFDTLSWLTCMETELGWPANHYELIASRPSIEQSGATSKIFKRHYPFADVYIRPRDGMDAKWGDVSTPIAINLDGLYRKLNIDGTLGDLTDVVALAGGEGAIMIPNTSIILSIDTLSVGAIGRIR